MLKFIYFNVYYFKTIEKKEKQTNSREMKKKNKQNNDHNFKYNILFTLVNFSSMF